MAGATKAQKARKKRLAQGFRDAMRQAFETTMHDRNGQRTLIQVVLAKAYNDKDPKQMNAIQFAAAYAYGLPKAGLDEATIQQLGQEMATKMFEAAVEEARKRRMLESTPAEVVSQDQTQELAASGPQIPPR